MDNPANLATLGTQTQDEDKQNKQHVLDTTINNANKTRALLQTTGGKDEPNTAFTLSLDV